MTAPSTAFRSPTDKSGANATEPFVHVESSPSHRPFIERSLLFCLGSGVCFAVMGCISRGLAPVMSWQVSVMARSLIALGVSAIVLHQCGLQGTLRGSSRLWVRSVCGTLHLLAVFYVLPRMPGSGAWGISQTAGIWAAVIAWIWRREQLGRFGFVFMTLGVAGLACLSRLEASVLTYAGIIILLGAILFGIAIDAMRRLENTHVAFVVWHFSLVASLAAALAVGLAATDGTLRMTWSWSATGSLAAIGALGAVGQFLMTKGLAGASVLAALVLGWSQVASSSLLDVLVWSDHLGRVGWLGLGLIVMSSALLSRSAKRQGRQLDERAAPQRD